MPLVHIHVGAGRSAAEKKGVLNGVHGRTGREDSANLPAPEVIAVEIAEDLRAASSSSRRSRLTWRRDGRRKVKR